jgi:membrane associated rhomboid family serine protease/ssDNA-binding Zn-finger/Zn-ribbon topoisomerase 1
MADTIGQLICPVDGTNLDRVAFQGIEVDVCPKCGGIWFDRSELDDVMREAMAQPQSVTRLDPQAGAPTQPTPHREIVCPRCQKTMLAEIFGRVSNIELDRCPQCRGQWADGGELSALVRYLHDPGESQRMQKLGEAIAQTVKKRESLKDLATLGRQSSQRVMLGSLFLPKIILPLGTSVGIRRFPLVSVVLVLVNILIYVYQIAGPDTPQATFERFGLTPARIAEGQGIYTFFTHMFIHGGALHLLGNMFFLWIFARAIEDAFGRWKFLGTYLLLGLTAGLIFFLFNLGGEIPAVGASGAISGIMGAFLVRYPSATIPTFVIQTVLHVPTWLYLGVWIGWQLLAFLVVGSVGTCSGVALSAHIGGFFAGIILTRFYQKKDKRR